MAGATQLSIYNGALSAFGERQLLALTERAERRRALDDVWSRDAVKTCLAAGQWHFAMRSAKWDYSPDFTPPFGYKRAFDLPDDWIRGTKVCEDEYMNVPLLNFVAEGEFIYADLDIIYASWVSSDIAYGMNLAEWPENFCRFVELYFASKVVKRLTGSDAEEVSVNKKLDIASKKAKATDAMEEPTQFLPPGTWSQARRGRRTRLERGNRSQLIG